MKFEYYRCTKIKDSEGAAAVEFALLLPLLALIIVGIMTFGLILHDYLEITHAAREGVRWAALRAPEADVKAKAIDAASISLTPADVQVTFGNPEGPLPGDWPDEAYQDEPVHVTVNYDISDVKEILTTFYAGFLAPDIITSRASQRVE